MLTRKRLVIILFACGNLLAANAGSAAPAYFVDHNNTNESFSCSVAGVSDEPTPPGTIRQPWKDILAACKGHTVDGICIGDILVNPGQPNEINIGKSYLDVNTGELFPHRIAKDGYALIVDGPGEVTLEYDSKN